MWLVLQALSVAWPCSPTLPGPWLLSPAETAPRDTAIVVGNAVFTGGLELRRVGTDETVPVLTFRPAGLTGFAVLEPLVPLEVGGQYRVVDSGLGSNPFTVVSQPAMPAGPPVPIKRRLVSDVVPEIPLCGGSAATYVWYEVCHPGPLLGVVRGDDPPSGDLLDVLDDLVALTPFHDVGWSAELDLAPGVSHTLWFATFDSAGRASAWAGPETFVMPRRGYSVSDTVPDYEPIWLDSKLYWPETCPEGGAWERSSTRQCPRGSSSCDEVEPDRAYATGCATAGAGPWVWWLGVVGLLIGRARPR